MPFTEEDVEIELRKTLNAGGISGIQFVWPNQIAPEGSPYATVEYVPIEVRDKTISGSDPIFIAQFIVNIAVQIGTGTQSTNQFASQIRALFYMGKRITTTDFVIEVTNHPERKPPYRDGTSIRTPIVVSISAS